MSKAVLKGLSGVLALALGVAVLATGCGDKSAKQAAENPGEPSGPNLTAVPDAGKVESVAVKARGMGESPAAAVIEALKSAILQVNGTTMSTASISTNFGIDVAGASVAAGEASVTTRDGTSTASGTASVVSLTSVRGREFAEQVVQRSGGAVTGFSVLDSAGPDDKGIYTVSIEAKIAKFKAPADAGKIRIVVAPLKSAKTAFNVAGQQVPSAAVLGALRQQIIDALSQTGRFTVLDREFAADVASELDMIASGQTPNADFARLGQALSADLIWVGVVNDFDYARHARKLQTSDRELVSFSGGWSMSQRLINVTTRQIVISTTLAGRAPSVAPTTLGASVDPVETSRGMQSDIVKQATEAIMLRTFPISIVERDGSTVVLSQGGKALAEGSRYRVYLQGKEIKDPQTGQSLGNLESLCCEVLVERVTPTLSYGRLENVKVSLDGVAPGALQLREAAPVAKVVASASASASGDALEPAARAARPPQQRRAASGESADAGAPAPVIKSNDW